MTLNDVWFTLIAVLWTGYFLLEGFDFGVGILLPVLGGRDEKRRRVLLNTIGPVWDGNEVWLLVAGGATFAAFPEWYASLFSGFYLPLLIILVALILRGVAFEYRGKIDSDRWRANWDRAIFFGSLVPALLWGVAFANIVRGVPLNAEHHYAGGFFDLLNPYALLGGAATLLLFTTHGAVFLALKTSGEVRDAARKIAAGVGGAALLAAGGFLLWTQLAHGNARTAVTAALAAAGVLAALAANAKGREGWAFLATAVTVVAATATLFLALYPNVLPSSLDPASSLNVTNAASTPYTLKIMTWVAVAFTPIVLVYQGWTYWVFRKRIGVEHIPPALPTPVPAQPADGAELVPHP
jgi:cytochrome d ubiquinol oxidase subunit II